MRVKFGLAGLLAALALAGLPAVASAGWCTGLTAGLRPPPEAPDAEAGKSSGEDVFQLTCRWRRRCCNYNSGYGAYSSGYGAYSSGCGSCSSGHGGYSSSYSSYYYPSYSSYSSYWSNGYYPGYRSASYYPSSSYYLSASYYPAGCGGWAPAGGYSGW